MSGPLISSRFLMPGAAPGSAQYAWKLYSYAAGSATPQSTYADSSLLVKNPNPMLMDAMGSAKVWVGDLPYKLIGQDTTGVNRWSEDNVSQAQVGVNLSEWQPIVGPVVFVTPTSMLLPSYPLSFSYGPSYPFQIGCRIKSQNSAGVIYSTVIAVSSVANNTQTLLTVRNDSGALDVGLSSAYYGLISQQGTPNGAAQTPSMPYGTNIARAMWTTAAVPASAITTFQGATGGTNPDVFSEMVPNGFTPIGPAAVYRVNGTAILTNNAGSGTVANSGWQLQLWVGAGAVQNIPFTWPYGNLVLASLMIPFDFHVTVPTGQTCGLAMSAPAYTGPSMVGGPITFAAQRVFY